jgi:hydroxymethylbilane synthase
VGTRIKKLEGDGFDAIVLAAAGVKRLKWGDKIAQYIDKDICLPAIGQGAIGVEIRSDDQNTLGYIKDLDHQKSHIAIKAERALLEKLEGGCQVPIAGYGEANEKNVSLKAAVFSPDGKQYIEESDIAPLNKAEQLGYDLAERLQSKGADKIIQEALKIANNV